MRLRLLSVGIGFTRNRTHGLINLDLYAIIWQLSFLLRPFISILLTRLLTLTCSLVFLLTLRPSYLFRVVLRQRWKILIAHHLLLIAFLLRPPILRKLRYVSIILPAAFSSLALALALSLDGTGSVIVRVIRTLLIVSESDILLLPCCLAA